MSRSDDILYRWSINDIARLCKVDLTTARRWKRGAICPPETALMILAGDLGVFDPTWRGWTIRGETIYSPEGWEATMGDVRSLPLLRQINASYRSENRNLREMLDVAEGLAIEEQPLPGEVAFQIK